MKKRVDWIKKRGWGCPWCRRPMKGQLVRQCTAREHTHECCVYVPYAVKNLNHPKG